MAESSTGKNEEKYSIDTELSSGNVKFLPEFLKRNFLLQQEKYREFRNIEVNVENGRHVLSYRVLVPRPNQYVEVIVEAEL
jgi:hypothetical protein